MEGRIEARHLRQLGIEAQERLDRPDLAGQVVGIVGDDPAQLVEDLGRDQLRTVEAVAPVDDAMTDDGDVRRDRPGIRVARSAGPRPPPDPGPRPCCPPPEPPSASAMTNREPGIPIRSTRPDRRRTGRTAVANSANLRLDEPPLIVRMQDRSARSDAMRLDPAGISMLWRDMAIVRSARNVLTCCRLITAGTGET